MRKVARIGVHYAHGSNTPVWTYNLYQHDVALFIVADLDTVKAYARQHGCTHYKPHRAYDYRTKEEQREDDTYHAWEPVLLL